MILLDAFLNLYALPLEMSTKRSFLKQFLTDEEIDKVIDKVFLYMELGEIISDVQETIKYNKNVLNNYLNNENLFIIVCSYFDNYNYETYHYLNYSGSQNLKGYHEKYMKKYNRKNILKYL